MAQAPYLTDPSNPVTPEVLGLQRQQALAQLLTQKSLEQPQGQVISGHYVAPSWAQQLSPVFAGVMGQKLGNDVEQKQLALAEQLRQQSAEDIVKYNQMKYGSPDQATYGAGEEGPTRTIIPGQEANPMGAYQFAMKSKSPVLNQMAMESLKPQKLAEGESVSYFNPFTGKYEVAATGGNKQTNEQKDYAQAVQQGFKGSLLDYQTAIRKASAPSVSVSTGKDLAGQVGDIAKESRTNAMGAVQQADAANRIISAVDSNKLFSGPGANTKLTVAQLGQALGTGGKDQAETIANTRQAMQGLAQLTLQGRKQMRGEGSITESEGALAQRAISGDLNLTAAEIRQLAEAAKRSAKFVYGMHQNLINTMGQNPEAKGLTPYYQVPANPGMFEPTPRGGVSDVRAKADEIIGGK